MGELAIMEWNINTNTDKINSHTVELHKHASGGSKHKHKSNTVDKNLSWKMHFLKKKRLWWIDCLWTNSVWNFITIRTVIEIFRPRLKFCRDSLADLCRHPEWHNWKSGYISIKDSGSCESRRLWLIPCQKGNYCSGLRKVAERHTRAPPPPSFFFSTHLGFVFSGGQHSGYSRPGQTAQQQSRIFSNH